MHRHVCSCISKFLDVSSEPQIAEHIRSYGGGKKLYPKARIQPAQLLKLLIAQVTRLCITIAQMVDQITTMISSFIDAQTDLVMRLSSDKKAYLGRVLTAQLNRLNVIGNEGYMANHYQYVEALFVRGVIS